MRVSIHGLRLASFIAIAGSAFCQFRAGIEGTVLDPSTAAVPGTDITLRDPATGRERQTTSSSSGFYRFSELAPGTYSIVAKKSGFADLTQNDIQVAGESVRGVDLHLATAQTSTSVTVNGSAIPNLDSENANVQRSLTSTEILRLPEIGRDPYELLRLTPGILGDGSRNGAGQSIALPNTTGPGGSNLSIFQVENQVPIVANGQRLSANNFLLDGVSVNSLTWGGAAVVTPNQESVSDITVSSNAYSADLGRNSGAQIQVVSKNGTNELHGSAAFKYDDPNFNAYNKFGAINAPTQRVENSFRQYAGSLGGPIRKNRLFYFFSYEGLHNSSNNPTTGYVETPQYRQAVLSLRPDSTTAKVLGSAGMDPRVIAGIPIGCASTFAPGACQQVSGGLDLGSITGTRGNYTTGTGGGLDGIPDVEFALFGNPASQTGNQYNGRVDYTHGRDTIAVSSYVTLFNGITADPSTGSRPGADVRNKPITMAETATWNHIFSPTLINEAKGNFTRFSSDEIAASSATNWGIPRVQVESYAFGDLEWGAGQSEASPALFAQNTIEGRDTLNWVRGSHALKFGVETRREQDNNNLAGGARPLYSFTGLFNLANDTPVFESINADPRTGAPAPAQRYFRDTIYAGFIQDDWKVTPSFTLNLGLRYEYFSAPNETRGNLSNLVFGPNALIDSRLAVTDTLYEADRLNFAPRFGFAWNPAQLNKRVVLRGGFGMFYNRVPDALFDNSRSNPPFLASYSICCGTASSPFDGGQIAYALGANDSPFSYPANPALATGINPVTLAPNPGPTGPAAVQIWGTPQHVATPYAYTYSFEATAELPGRVVATAGYQGSTGHKLIRIVNQNYLYPNNPSFGPVYFIQPDVNSNYNAFLFTVRRSLSNGLQFQANYRWAHSIDQASYEGPGFVTNQTYPQDLHFERGDSDFDVRHNFNLSVLYEIPSGRVTSRLARAALAGWQINAIFTAHTGFPWTPVTGQSISTPGGPSLSPTRPIAYFGGALTDHGNDTFLSPNGDFPGGGAKYFDISASGIPGIGRNTLRGPDYIGDDFSLAKQVHFGRIRGLGENAMLDLRVNLFNAFNRLNLAPFNFGDSNTHVEDPNFGRAITGLAGRVVELQGRFSF
ncbi:MAG TPA: carboxypeptidase regulatory-like domain-containing protein [Bryobacteraceae bacterium]|nr:carboxypeptidase regulatory-like domain-containing protein [Bryobacteraceae bacterium]